MLVFIGLGYSTKHLTQEAIEELRSADIVYIDTYTSLYEDSFEKLTLINPSAEYIYAKRRDLEGPSIVKLVTLAKVKKVVIAVPGDPFIATTHDAIWNEAVRQGVEVKVVHGISIVSMVYSRLGLQSYKFGKHVTLVYPNYFKPFSSIEVIYGNLSRNLHTLVLLDLRIEESKIMTIPEAVEIILELDEKKLLRDQLAIGVARLGWRDEKICADVIHRLRLYNYPPPPHSLIVVARPSPIEEEFIEYWKRKC